MPENKVEMKGKCFLLGRCDWWNPPLEMVFDGKERDFCIRCWRFKTDKLSMIKLFN